MDIREVERLTLDVMQMHGCHTAILYGSWARGQAGPQSDIDILCVRETGPAFRDARMIGGVYLDAFIYSETDLELPDAELLRVLGGRVLSEAKACGTSLLDKLKAIYDRGPAPMSDDLRQVTLVWSRKMLDRFRERSDLEAQYRRNQLFLQALEDYFALRGSWFPGPKDAFAWLRQHDPAALQCFQNAAQSLASDATLAALVEAVYVRSQP